MMMNTWLYNEFRHCGTDYADAGQADVYDEQHLKFRNYEREFWGMIDFLGLHDTENMTMIDLGCGTGATAIYAAGRFRTVYAVDVSEVMIGKAKKKITTPAQNLRFVHAGFLSYDHAGDPADLVVSKAAFHHLPDFWKQVALLRMNRMVKSGGLLYLHDIVFQFEPQEYERRINAWISRFGEVAGEEFRREVETHIRDEYSTFGWILEGMLKKAGFSVEKCRSSDGFLTEYACRNVKDPDR